MPKRTHKDLSQLTQTIETQAAPLLEPVKEQGTTHRATRVVYIPFLCRRNGLLSSSSISDGGCRWGCRIAPRG